MEFNQRTLEKLAPGPTNLNFSDPKTPGLVLRVTPTGAKTYFFTYRMGGRGTPKKWLKVGDFSALPLNRAQLLARSYRSQVDAGTDPAAAMREATTVGETIASLAQKFRTEYLPKKSRSTQESYSGALAVYILPKLGKLAVRTLTRDQVTTWHQAIEKPRAANIALSVLSKMMNLAIEVWDMRPDGLNPCRHVERNPETPRLQDVQPQELVAIGQALKALEGERSPWALAAVKVAALCWGRVSEVLSLRRDRDIFLDEGYAIIRDHKTQKKTGAKRLELPPPAVAILRKLPKDGDNPYFFPGHIKNRPLTRDGLHKVWMTVREKAGVEDLHIHDFRSMAASESEAQGINPKTAAAILGHADVRTTMKHYTKARNTQEAAAKVAAPIARALSGKIAKGKKNPRG